MRESLRTKALSFVEKNYLSIGSITFQLRKLNLRKMARIAILALFRVKIDKRFNVKIEYGIKMITSISSAFILKNCQTQNIQITVRHSLILHSLVCIKQYGFQHRSLFFLLCYNQIQNTT